MPGATRHLLPCGYVADDGSVHRDVELSALTGAEEELLGSLPPITSSAGVITMLLARKLKRIGSIEPVTERLVRDLLVGDREYLVARLRELTLGPKVGVVCICANHDCARPMDICFYLPDLMPESKPVIERFFTRRFSGIPSATGQTPDGWEVEFRLPTGADQELLASVAGASEDQAVNLLLARCVRRAGGSDQINEATVARWPDTARLGIAGEMESMAAEVESEMEVNCPECGETFSTPFDLTSFFLREMRCEPSDLEREVHCLASTYHWSQHEILSLPTRKRRRYIQLIQEQFDSIN
jgi:hypothetical protein